MCKGGFLFYTVISLPSHDSLGLGSVNIKHIPHRRYSDNTALCQSDFRATWYSGITIYGQYGTHSPAIIPIINKIIRGSLFLYILTMYYHGYMGFINYHEWYNECSTRTCITLPPSPSLWRLQGLWLYPGLLSIAYSYTNSTPTAHTLPIHDTGHQKR